MAEIKGGEELARKLRELARKFGHSVELRVGFLEGATYPDGTSVAMVAAAHNWGAPAVGLPPRPFFSRMVDENKKGWPELIASQLRKGTDARAAMMFTGQIMKEQLQQAIHDTNSPPLKPATVKAKGFDTVLIDTAHMLNSVGYEINEPT